MICVELGAGSRPSRSHASALELGVGGGVRPDRARELADAHPVERAGDALPVARELERPAGELQAERRRLGVDAVRAADLERLAMLLGARHDRGERGVEPREDERARLADLQRERRVDDVGGREAVVEPAAPLVVELLADGVDERGGVVVERRLDLGDALRRSAASRRRWRGGLGRTPSSAQRRSRPARPRATSQASPRPTRCWPWRTGVAGNHWPSLEASRTTSRLQPVLARLVSTPARSARPCPQSISALLSGWHGLRGHVRC